MTQNVSALIDLTHPITPQVPVFPGDPQCTFTAHATFEQSGYRVTALHMGTHQGTHMDAPSHFVENGMGVHEVALQRMCGPATLIDMKAKGSAGDTIDVADLEPYAERFVANARVLLYTGWESYFGTAQFYERSPGLTPAACSWLATKGLAVLGLDLPTLHTEAVSETHVPLLSAGVAIVESLKLSPLLPYADKPFLFFAAPLPLVGLDGSPLRAFAAIPSNPGDGDCNSNSRVWVEPVSTAYQMLDAFLIRDTVFVHEQGVDMSEEHDDQDRHALHALAYVDGHPVGTLRLLRQGSAGTVGRFAVLKEYRGRGVGQELMAWVIRSARTLGLHRLHLHAQTHAAGFYRRLGFEVCGPEFMEAGIPHVPMERTV